MTSCMHRLSVTLASLCFGLLLSSNSVNAANYAVLVAISDYPQIGVEDKADLLGTLDDIKSFRKLANKLGVPDANIVTLIDQEANPENIGIALGSLISKVTERDKVLFAYSGHGAQLHNPRSQKTDQCSEGIVTVDSKANKPVFVEDTDLREVFDILSEKAGKVLVFFDSCFSGGALTTRGIENTGGIALRQKIYRGEVEGRANTSCGKAVNARGLSRGLTEGKQNMVYFAAAARDEVALDAGKGLGGLGTVAWMQCLSDPVSDQDRSGAISAGELHSCAQKKVREISIKHFGLKDSAQHPQMEGAANVTIAFNEQPTSAPPTSGDSPGSAVATLIDLYSGRNQKWETTLISSKGAYKIRQEPVELTLTSSRKGYVYLLMVGTGTDSKGSVMIFPNEIDRENAIQPGQLMQLPRKGKWRLMPGGPAGTDHLLAIITEKPINLSKAELSKAAIFLQSGTSPDKLAALQRSFSRSLVVESDQDSSDDNYGAAMIKVNEID